MSNSLKPTVLIVHGSWHAPAHYEPLGRRLEERGYNVFCPPLPSWHADPRATTLRADADAIEQALKKLVEDEQRHVVVVAHSYGGIVASEAVKASYGRKERAVEGKEGGVLHIVYMCAIVVEEGKSLVDQWGPLPKALPETLICSRTDGATAFFNDVAKDELERGQYVQKLVRGSVKPDIFPTTYAAYKHYPVTYILCTEDNVWPYKACQEVAVRDILVKNGAVVAEKILRSGHSPFITLPGEVAEFVDEIVEATSLDR
ncbi:alpha beta-hydrolase [Coniophora puteana RWD-64-598 SS2]|uniref:Alpha beta-hydrolase n=1 Tax=Coniophora puteana (strain RWD-64-598) TaxID=741705 RepID=A0A5M3MXB3_CONPW|nr:alpha beta-hydrolase [Coniophora puteana RWD-64-598 SS2]EIW83281.1 alpha beta-hydrolase [Coniophora puteana RWD-64-598 SS2]